MRLEARDPAFEARVRASFARQDFMALLGMRLSRVEPGAIDIVMDHDDGLRQQHGFVHGGVVTAGMDSATGFCALSLMPAGTGVLTVEMKTSFLAPARGERFRFEGRVIKPGRTLVFTEGRGYAISGGVEKLVATLSATCMCVEGREGVKG